MPPTGREPTHQQLRAIFDPLAWLLDTTGPWAPPELRPPDDHVLAPSVPTIPWVMRYQANVLDAFCNTLAAFYQLGSPPDPGREPAKALERFQAALIRVFDKWGAPH